MEKPRVSLEDVASNLYYLANGILNNTEDRNIHDGMGQDVFIAEHLYPIAEFITQLEYHGEMLRGKPGVYAYEFCEVLAVEVYYEWFDGEDDSIELLKYMLQEKASEWFGINLRLISLPLFTVVVSRTYEYSEAFKVRAPSIESARQQAIDKIPKADDSLVVVGEDRAKVISSEDDS